MGQAIRQKVVTSFFLQLLNNQNVDWKGAGEIGIMVSLPKKEPGHEEFI